MTLSPTEIGDIEALEQELFEGKIPFEEAERRFRDEHKFTDRAAFAAALLAIGGHKNAFL